MRVPIISFILGLASASSVWSLVFDYQARGREIAHKAELLAESEKARDAERSVSFLREKITRENYEKRLDFERKKRISADVVAGIGGVRIPAGCSADSSRPAGGGFDSATRGAGEPAEQGSVDFGDVAREIESLGQSAELIRNYALACNSWVIGGKNAKN